MHKRIETINGYQRKLPRIHDHYHHRQPAALDVLLPMLPLMHPLCTTLLSGNTRIALPPNLLWQTAQCLSSSITTLLFSPPGTFLPYWSVLLSAPSSIAASTATFSTPRKCDTMRSSLSRELAFRIRPKKYDSRSLTGSVGGMRSSVVAAGRRAPCLERSSRAGGQLGWFGGGGERYRDRRTW